MDRFNFKYKVGDEVNHKSHGYNAIVTRKLYIEDEDSHYRAYDVAVWQQMPPLEGMNIPELCLKPGHRIE